MKLLLILFLLLFNFSIRLAILNSPKIAYLDEKTYFIPTLRNTINGIPDTSNEQPQLAKNIIVQSMKLFGDNPWGWRIPSVIFGTFMVLGTYLLAKKVFDNQKIALLSMFFITFEFVLFIHSRILMMEVFFATFVVYAFVFVWSHLESKKDKDLIIAGIIFGLSASVKWSAAIPFALAALFIFVEHSALTKKIYYLLIFFFITLFVYLIQYIPSIATIGVNRWVKLHQQVWYYHTVEFPEIYKKYAAGYIPRYQEGGFYLNHIITWPLNPGGLYFEQNVNPNKVSVVLFFANPIVFWGGLIALIVTSIKKVKDKRVLFINSVFLTSYLSLFVIKGPVFPHYLLFGIPSLAIILSYFLVETLKLSNTMIFFILVLTVIIFGLYYPLLTALPVPKWYFYFLTRY